MTPLFPEVVVNGETVPQVLIAAEVQNHSAPQSKPGIAWRKAARAMAMRTLLLQVARMRDIAAVPEEVAPGRFETEEEALIRGLLQQEVDVIPPSEDAVYAEWNKNPSRFRAPPLWEVSHILIACDPRNSGETEAARVRATELNDRVRKDPGALPRLASESSDCASGRSGGALGQISPGDSVPEFEVALRDLPDGAVTQDPVLTRHGWHVIRMNACAPGTVLPYESARPRVAEAMEKAAWARAANAFVTGLVHDAVIDGVDMHANLAA